MVRDPDAGRPVDRNQPSTVRVSLGAPQPDAKHVPPQTAYLIGYNVGALRLWRRYVEFGQLGDEGADGLIASLGCLLREVTRFADSLPTPLFTSFRASFEQLDQTTRQIVANADPVDFGPWDQSWEGLSVAVAHCMEGVSLVPWYRLGREVASYHATLQEQGDSSAILHRRDLPALSDIQRAIAQLPHDARMCLPSADRLVRLPADSPLGLVESSLSRKGTLSDAEDYSVTAMVHAVDYFHKRLFDELGALSEDDWSTLPVPATATSQQLAALEQSQRQLHEQLKSLPEAIVSAFPAPSAGPPPPAPPTLTLGAGKQPEESDDGYGKGYLGLQVNRGSCKVRRRVKGRLEVVDFSDKLLLWNLFLKLYGSGEDLFRNEFAKHDWEALGGQCCFSAERLDDAYYRLGKLLKTLDVKVTSRRRLGRLLEQGP